MPRPHATYLSIDLDYWSEWRNNWQARDFFKRVFSLGLKITVALHHHHLLASINCWKDYIDRVINVDFHSDIADEDDRSLDLHEGTWANFVAEQEWKTFEWRYPNDYCLSTSRGYCHSGLNPFEEKCTRWHRVIKRRGVARIPWQRICAVGVCLSPGWLHDKWTVAYPVEALDLYDLYGRWVFCTDRMGYDCKDAENGTGMFAPRLILPESYGRVV